MTIAKRLSILIAVSLLSLLGLGLGGIIGMGKLNEKLTLINENVIPSVDQLNEVTANMFQMRIKVLYHLLNEDITKQEAIDKEIASLRSKVKEGLTNYGANLVSDAEDKRLLGEDESALKDYEALMDKLLTMSRNLQKTDAIYMAQENAAITAKLSNTLLEHVRYNQKLSAEATEQSKATYSGLLKFMIILFVIAAILVAIVGRKIYSNVITSLSNLRDTLSQIESNLDFTKRATVIEQDEVGLTVEAVNRLTARLQSNLREIAQQSNQVTEAAAHLTETAHAVTESASNQSAAAADMAATVEEMTVSINHVADQAGEANQLSRDSGELAVNGEQTIIKTVEDINEIATTVRAAASYVDNLDRDSQRVNEVVGVIKDIADQTNLLALNAAIEAARAGEQGRGFAVVADEVRKLAERTSQSTQVIAETIAAMQSNARSTVDGMQAVDSRVSVGVERANAANQAIHQIRQGSSLAVERVSEISDAIREQGIASTSIAQQVERIAQMSEENHAAAENTSATAAELDRLAKAMKHIVSQYKI